ncbi:MAG: ribonuclease J, partial [Oscillospiraceae bacterium]
KVRGVFVTHGHEDHIGSLVFLLKQINVPIYSTKLTLSLIEGKLKEHGLLGQVKLHEVKARQVVKSGCFSVEFIEVNHSIPDACAFAITTPAGVIIQTGDFKMDYTPIHGGIIDIARFGELGSKGVLALLPDSTNAETPGYAMSERKVGHSFDVLFGKAAGKRIIVASFASNVYRIQQIVEYAHRYNRKVAVSGRSMENIVEKAVALGYLTVPKGTLVDIDMINRYSDDQVVLITTGSQGEPMSALSRMAGGDHRKVSVTANDFIIISARPIPGNEKLVNRVVNDLLKLGAEVIYEKMYEVHVSGHACQDELKLMMALTKPKFLVPVHGEFKHMKKQRDIGITLGIPEENIFIPQIGLVMETDGVDFRLAETVTSGRV